MLKIKFNGNYFSIKVSFVAFRIYKMLFYYKHHNPFSITNMKDKIINKAKEMFWNSVSRASLWMILQAKCVFKKTIYKYFANKELLIEESVQVIHTEVNAYYTILQRF
jgi:hypothetical protein